MTYSAERPLTTNCDRCGAEVKYRSGVEPEYCDGCHDLLRRRRIR